MEKTSTEGWFSKRKEGLQPFIVFFIVGALFSQITDPIPPLRNYIQDIGLTEFQFKSLLNVPFFIILIILWIIDNKKIFRIFTIIYALIEMTILYLYIFQLVNTITYFRGVQGAYILMTDVIVCWFINVIMFGLIYWFLDSGGPAKRKGKRPENIELLFPQYTMNTPESKDWCPNIIDYIVLSFSTSTTFGPTDTMFLSRKFKLLMIMEVLASLTILTVLATRAVTLLK